MKLSEQLQHTIETGEPCQGIIPGIITFTIHRRNIPSPLPERPADMPAMKTSGLNKWDWKTAQALHEREFVYYQKMRLLWIEERKTIARLQKIKKMAEHYGL